MLGFAPIIAARAAWLAGRVHTPVPRGLTDWDVFFVAGRMAWLGRMSEAYDYATLKPFERALKGADTFLPWSYPPQFDLLLAPFALLPIWAGYALFAAGTLLAYMLVLRRLTGRQLGLALLTIFPGLWMSVSWGQNGTLTGAFTGLTCLWSLKDRPIRAGLALGAMAIKPHLAAGLAINALATRRWRMVLAAAGLVAVSALVATVAFDPSIWAAFWHGAAQAGRFLKAGDYPLYRMISIYAVVRTLGAPAWIALAAQAVVAAGALAATALAIRQRLPQDITLAICVLASLLVSPYVYDYDLPIAGVAIALATPHLLRVTRTWEIAVIVALGWTASGWGYVQSVVVALRYGAGSLPKAVTPLTLAGGAYLILFAFLCRLLCRERAPAAQDAPAQSGQPRGASGRAKSGDPLSA